MILFLLINAVLVYLAICLSRGSNIDRAYIEYLNDLHLNSNDSKISAYRKFSENEAFSLMGKQFLQPWLSKETIKVQIDAQVCEIWMRMLK